MNNQIQPCRRKLLAGLLIMVILFSHLLGAVSPMTAIAGTLTSNKENLLDGKPFSFYGKEYRTSMFHWGHADGVSREQSAFCIAPTKEMYTGMTVSDKVYGVEDDFGDVGIDSVEQFQNICMVLQWSGAYQGKGMIEQGTYIVAQGALFAIMTGHSLDADFRMEMQKLKGRIRNKTYRAAFDGKLNDLIGFLQGDSGKNPLPHGIAVNQGMALVQRMEQEAEGYSLTFDISGCPELKSVTWKYPEGNWSKKVSGNMLTFFFHGGEEPSGMIIGSNLPAALQAKIPKEGGMHILEPAFEFEQTLVTGFVPSGGGLYIRVNSTRSEDPQSPSFEIMHHSETFESNYNISLEKYDAETNQSLEGVVFEVLETFDGGQLGGLLQKRNMYPSPAVWSGQRVCATMTTDSEGIANHSDTRYYDYYKTYCTGHPEPEYQEAPEEETNPATGEVVNGEEMEAVWQENLRMEEEWEAGTRACEDEVDFHDVGGSGEEMMIENRDDTYHAFINLVYVYTVREIRARQGYILHGMHQDDEEIEVITTNSSEAGAGSRDVRERGEMDSELGETPDGRTALLGFAPVWNPLPISIPLFVPSIPSAVRNISLEEARKIAWKGSKASDSDADEIEEQIPYSEGDEAESFIFTYSSLLNELFQKLFESPKEQIDSGVTLPEPAEDNVASVIPGDRSGCSHTFKVYDHRTEGEIHINKRDLDLYEKDPEGSYGKTQGDATLEGAVYGLYVAEDLVYPDGKTGVVFARNDLVAVATTDVKGDAAFPVITETSAASEGAANAEGTWLGHPLLLGSYYIKEISRSEGYELSVFGIHLAESNRNAVGTQVMEDSGSANAGELSHRKNEWDGSWNDFTVRSHQTVHGYDVTLSGYPEDSTIYRVDEVSEEITREVITGSYLAVKTDAEGNPIYTKALGGECRLDREGNPIPCLDMTGNLVPDPTRPVTERLQVSYRLNLYPSGTAVPDVDLDKWEDATTSDADYVKAEANAMLSQLGYRLLDDDGGGAPWVRVELTGATNKDLITEILDWYIVHNFWDSARVESVEEADGRYRARLFVDYQALKADGIYDAANGVLYRKQPIEVEGGAEESYGWIAYEPGEFTLSGRNASIKGSRKLVGPISFGEEIETFLVARYEPLYETYTAGEIILDADQIQIPETEVKSIYETRAMTVEKEMLVPMNAVYDRQSGTYGFHVPNTTDWSGTAEEETVVYRAKAPERTILYQGVEMRYGDYLLEVAGCGADAMSTKVPMEAGSYLKSVHLTYPGQLRVGQDAGTVETPIIVLQRIIKQAIRVTKDIAQDSYDNVNTYRIHRDPFTVLFGGHNGKPGTKALKDFYFRLYKKADLVNTGKMTQKTDGSYDYELLMKAHPDLVAALALEWDIPTENKDRDLTTVHADKGTGVDDYYGTSTPLPYGTYVLVEQQPASIPNKHYQVDKPQEIVLPFVPEIDGDGTIHENLPSSDYLYDSGMMPEEQVKKFGIRFNEETDVLWAHHDAGDFAVYQYGLCSRVQEAGYEGSNSEDAGTRDSVYYEILYNRDGSVKDYGVTLDGVSTMTGVSTAVDMQYSAALVPWSVLSPVNGGSGNRQPGLDGEGHYNYVGYAGADMENRFYSSKIRIEKIDSETGENIIHDGAFFRIYAAKRDVKGAGLAGVAGSGKVLYKKEGITGTRAELEALGYVDDIIWDAGAGTYRGTVSIPDYDESELIRMSDDTGNEMGIFKAYSTVKEVVGENGKVEKIPAGYIETYQPLGAGVYVLVEIQAPEGYQISRPVAFEVYSDRVDYYEDGKEDARITAEKYQYAIPAAGEENKFQTTDVSRIKIKDDPAMAEIHKVESSDKKVGDGNGLDGLLGVNDKGDLLTYEVRGSRKYLDARTDVNDITWDADVKEYVGTVTKTYEEWSESLVRGTETELMARSGVKPLYEIGTGAFTGFGIQFGIYVKDSTLTLYDGLEIKRVMDHVYHGITVKWRRDQIVGIMASATGSHLEIVTTGKDAKPPYPDIWDAQEVDNEQVNVFFYDLDTVGTERDESTNELWVLDADGNRICYADSISGMAYVYDEYGAMIVYQADENGHKVVTQSIQTQEREEIYGSKESVLDEHGLPVYYKNVDMFRQEESWVTPERGSHNIRRIPFGAYVLEETEVPYEDGYIRAVNQGIVLKKTSRVQHFYLQNDFTKINIAKVDVSTKQEIQDAGMVLYKAGGQPYADWISGYQYDDNGNLKLIHGEAKSATAQPHWIDHIPVGNYVLKETMVPYEWGYVQSDPMEIVVAETGNVQTFVMEDDYTLVDMKKYDTKTGKVLGIAHQAALSLYPAVLDDEGKPMAKSDDGHPNQKIWLYNRDEKIITWKTGDSQDIVTLPVTPDIRQAQYYITEAGTTRFEYLPVGNYVLVEERTPQGYATADPVLITVTDVGHRERVQTYEMGDVPLTLEVSKTDRAGGKKQLCHANLAIYAMVDGKPGATPLYRWISGTDGVYTMEDEVQGLLPPGFRVGDLKIHRIEYIPAGDYILVEEDIPYGFLRAEGIPFTIRDTPDVQHVEMVDEIPEGLLTIVKHDAEHEEILLRGAAFEFRCMDTGVLLETMVTGGDGKATASDVVPIGYMDDKGIFVPYTYAVEEVDAPDHYMLNTGRFEFQFAYVDGETPLSEHTYDAMNVINQVKISKQVSMTDEELTGAELSVTGKYTKMLLDHWISTGQSHYITDISPGTYILTELATPGGGYAKAEPMEFTVTDSMSYVPHIIMYDQPTQVQIEKVSGNGSLLLEGAKLQLSKPDGTVIAEWVTGKEAHVLYGLEPGEYILTEPVVPEGYKKGKPMKIKVEDTVERQSFIYRNHKLIPETEEFDISEPEPKEPAIHQLTAGSITASYEWKSGNGSDWLPGLGLPKMGDHGVAKEILLLIFGISAGCLGLIYRKKGRKNHGKGRRRGLWMIGILYLLCAGESRTVWASPEALETAMITSGPCRRKEELELPEALYTDEAGVQYQLERWQMETVESPEESRAIEKEVRYHGFEAKAGIPKEVEIHFADSDSEYQVSRSYPAQDIVTLDEQWTEDFAFTVTFHTYGADYYELSEYRIPYEEDTPGLSGYETELLQMLGLPESDYQVEQVEWSGNSYTDEAGVLCRDALATGRKKVRDYRVVYGGSVTIPTQTLYQIEAVYQKVEEETQEVRVAETIQGTTASEMEMTDVWPGFWNIWRSTLVMTIGLGSLVILFTLLFVALHRKKRRKKS